MPQIGGEKKGFGRFQDGNSQGIERQKIPGGDGGPRWLRRDTGGGRRGHWGHLGRDFLATSEGFWLDGLFVIPSHKIRFIPGKSRVLPIPEFPNSRP